MDPTEIDFPRDSVRQLALLVSKLAFVVSEDSGEQLSTALGECEVIAVKASTIAVWIEQGAGRP